MFTAKEKKMAEGMIEKVARALSIADGMHPEAASNDDDEQPTWTLYVGMAKAAIEAMREPTEYMLDFGACHEDPHDYYGTDPIIEEGDLSRDVYRAMIDAAIKQEEEKA